MTKEPTLGERIRAARRAAGLSQSEVSKLSGISKPTLSRYENDHVLPSVATLHRIAGALDVPVSKLVAPGAEALLLDALQRRGVTIRDERDAERVAHLVAEITPHAKRRRKRA